MEIQRWHAIFKRWIKIYYKTFDILQWRMVLLESTFTICTSLRLKQIEIFALKSSSITLMTQMYVQGNHIKMFEDAQSQFPSNFVM
jgi:hypothetical protein